MKRLNSLFILIFSACLSFLPQSPSLAQQNTGDTISLTGFYPAPFGSYRKIQLLEYDPKDWPAKCENGSIAVQNGGELKFCKSNSWTMLPSVWNYDTGTGELVFNDTAAMNSFRMGIGTKSPQAKLHVKDDTAGIAEIRLENPSGSSQFSFYEGSGVHYDLRYNSKMDELEFRDNFNTPLLRVGNAGILVGGIDADVPSAQFEVRTAGKGNIIKFFDGATEVFTIDDTGNVGINNSAPKEKLDIVGNANITGNNTVSGDSKINGTATIDGNAGISTFGPGYLLNVSKMGGNVRIGNGAPNQLTATTGNLYVTGDLEVDGTVYSTNVSAGGWTEDGPTDRVFLTSEDDKVGFGQSNPLNAKLEIDNEPNGGTMDLVKLYRNGNPAITIDENAFLGMNANNPLSPLDIRTVVSAANSELSAVNISSAVANTIGGAGKAEAIGINLRPNLSMTSGGSQIKRNIALKVSPTYMGNSLDQNVGIEIGCDALDKDPNSSCGYGDALRMASVDADINFYETVDLFAFDRVNYNKVDPDRLALAVISGHGKNAPPFGRTVFLVHNDGHVYLYQDNACISKMDDNGSPGVDIAGDCKSDLRLKQNVHSLSGSLSKILQLNPVDYEFKNPKNGNGIRQGLIAQEVEKVFPDWVSEGSDGYKRVDYNLQMQMHMIQAMKEMHTEFQQEIDALKKENEELKAKLEGSPK